MNILLRLVPAMIWLLASVAAQSDPPEPALASERAVSSLLLSAARAGSRLVAVGHRGHVVFSDDNGQSWRQAKSVPVRSTLTAVYFIDGQHGWIVGHDAVILHSSDGGNTWQLQNRDPALETPLFSLWFEDSRHGLAVGAYGLALRTHNGGQSWERFFVAEDEDLHLNHIVEAADDTLLMMAEQGTIYRSPDHGASWTTVRTASPGSFWGGVALRAGQILVFGMRGHTYRSEDGGENWIAVDSGTEQSLSAATEIEEGRLVVTGLGGTLLQSHDGGKSFQANTLPKLHNYSAVISDTKGSLLLFGDAGVERFSIH